LPSDDPFQNETLSLNNASNSTASESPRTYRGRIPPEKAFENPRTPWNHTICPPTRKRNAGWTDPGTFGTHATIASVISLVCSHRVRGTQAKIVRLPANAHLESLHAKPDHRQVRKSREEEQQDTAWTAGFVRLQANMHQGEEARRQSGILSLSSVIRPLFGFQGALLAENAGQMQRI
jgi:hypothetical protein